MIPDYRGSEQGKYPPPEERTNKDFPSVDELYVYGDDFPLPNSEGELRCPYNFIEGVTWKDLEGYRVPPLGALVVTRAGGAQYIIPTGGRLFVYPPGTFYEDKVTLNKELGATTTQITAIREQNRLDAINSGVERWLEEKGEDALKNIKGMSLDILEALTYKTLDMIVEAENPREMLNFLKWADKRTSDKTDAVARNEGARLTLDEARQWIELGRKAKQEGSFDFRVVDGEVEDIEGDVVG